MHACRPAAVDDQRQASLPPIGDLPGCGCLALGRKRVATSEQQAAVLLSLIPSRGERDVVHGPQSHLALATADGVPEQPRPQQAGFFGGFAGAVRGGAHA